MTTLFLKEPFAAAFGKKEIAVDYGKKNVQPAHYYPCKRKDVEAMFRTPSPKHRGSSNASQSSKASIKGNLADVKKMEEMLEDSAGESLDDEDEDMVEENGSEEDESEHEAESEKDAEKSWKNLKRLRKVKMRRLQKLKDLTVKKAKMKKV